MPPAAFLLMCIGSGLSTNCEAQDNPVVKVHAYEREVVGGIPGGPPGVGAPARQTRYFIYLETNPKVQFTVDGVWMGGKVLHGRNVDQESAGAVRVSGEAGAGGEEHRGSCDVQYGHGNRGQGSGAGQDTRQQRSQGAWPNQAVVQLSYLGKSVLFPVNKFEKRDPLFSAVNEREPPGRRLHARTRRCRHPHGCSVFCHNPRP